MRLLHDIYFEANHIQIQTLNLVRDFLNSPEFFIVEDRLYFHSKFPFEFTVIYSPNEFAFRIQLLGNCDITKEIRIPNNSIRETSGGYLLYVFHGSLAQQEDIHMVNEEVPTDDEKSFRC